MCVSYLDDTVIKIRIYKKKNDQPKTTTNKPEVHELPLEHLFPSKLVVRVVYLDDVAHVVLLDVVGLPSPSYMSPPNCNAFFLYLMIV